MNGDHRTVAPTLMLGFGLLGLGVGVWEFLRIQANPEPLVVSCGPAIETVDDDCWVVLEGCEVLVEDIFELRKSGDIEELLLPLRPPGRVALEAPAAVLATRDYETIKAYEEFDRADDADPELPALAEALLSKLEFERIEGVTSTRYGRLGDRQSVAFREHFNIPDRGIVSINQSRIPSRGLMFMCLLAALVLLPLSVVYFRRARKQSPPPPPRPFGGFGGPHAGVPAGPPWTGPRAH